TDAVVRDYRRDPVARGLLYIEHRELRVGVPGGPALAGVHAAGEVLIAERERRGRAERRRSVGPVGHPYLERPARPLRRKRRKRSNWGGAGDRDIPENAVVLHPLRAFDEWSDREPVCAGNLRRDHRELEPCDLIRPDPCRGLKGDAV